MDVVPFLYNIAPGALRAANPPGYVINALEKHLKEKFGVEKTDSGFSIPNMK